MDPTSASSFSAASYQPAGLGSFSSRASAGPAAARTRQPFVQSPDFGSAASPAPQQYTWYQSLQSGWSALSYLARQAIDFFSALLQPQTQTADPERVQSEPATGSAIGLLAQRPGAQPKLVASYSHFNDPIDFADGTLHGNSRRWGDAPYETQNAVIGEILIQTAARGWNPLNQSFALALARVESGFNPDAAAGSTSASGIGQMVDATATALGLDSGDRFSISGNVGAMLDLIDQNRLIAERRLPGSADSSAGLALQYALYHDGPSLNYGGMQIAQQQVVPWAEKINSWLGSQEPQYQTPLDPFGQV